MRPGAAAAWAGAAAGWPGAEAAWPDGAAGPLGAVAMRRGAAAAWLGAGASCPGATPGLTAAAWDIDPVEALCCAPGMLLPPD